jgi:hypothetical protein
MANEGSEYGGPLWPYRKQMQEAVSSQYDINRIYLNWLTSYLYALHLRGEGEDPYKEGSKAYKQIADAAKRIDEGWNVASLPYFDQFYEVYQGIYPTEAAATPQETEYLEAQIANIQAQTQQILNDIAASGQITPYQQAQLDLAAQELEYTMQQAGIGNEQEWAQIDLQRQQLAQSYEAQRAQTQLEYNQWQSGLQASPATFLERWYAEKLPWGGERIPLASDIYTQGGQYPEWASSLTAPNPYTQGTTGLRETPAWNIP